MNLRNAQNYTIGLDLGTGSVGWAVVDENGELYHIKGMPTWGSRTFPGGDTAADTRLKRGARRRYERRRQRIEYLRELFAEEMDKVDPDFFIRMRLSRLTPKDRNNRLGAGNDHPLFNDRTMEADYYARFPTIYHLRSWLMQTDEQADLRLINLALHNIVKYRGNFLHEDEGASLSAANADATRAAQALVDALINYADEHTEDDDDVVAAWSCNPDARAIKDAIDTKGLYRAARHEHLAAALGFPAKSRVAKTIGKACFGYIVKFADVFAGTTAGESTKCSVGDDEKARALLENLADDALPVLEAIQGVYSAYLLSEILEGSTSISQAMIASYDRHDADLADLKGVVRDYLGMTVFNELFRGPLDERGDYDINGFKDGTYTAYIAGESKCSHENLMKQLKKAFQSVDDSMKVRLHDDVRFERIWGHIEAEDEGFLAKQKTRANGAIPYQLHLEEMNAIILNQGRFYPFLLQQREAMEKIVSSRIPYYVGPLNGGHDPAGEYPGNKVDPTRKFAWSVRKPGMKNAKAYPWNVDEVIDADATAELFIRRMTGDCTYLYGEPVLPRCSLLYEEFCVLNELNGARWSDGARDSHRFDWEYREALIEDVFKDRKTVPNRAVAEWLKEKHGVVDGRLTGTQSESGFESKLSSYNDFRNILGVNRLEDDNCPLSLGDIEKIILWNTVFEDRDILQRRIKSEYGDRLTDDQVKKIVHKRYTGWGRLSQKFLTGVQIATPTGPVSIMDVMREGDPVEGHHRRALNLMETLRDETLGFQRRIDEINRAHFSDGVQMTVDDLQGSPALRRTVNQAMRILDELVGIAGKPPARICIEVTRDDDKKKKGSRTKRRYESLERAYQAFEEDCETQDSGLWSELKRHGDGLDDKRLMLYFAQRGKSLYSQESLDINKLSEYQIDHILPQSYIKDDSFDNMALVLRSENQRKLDTLLLPDSVINGQRHWWAELRRAGLISEKKYNNLMRREIKDEQMKGFINRQIVETSQIVKFVREMCEQRFPETKVVSHRASLTSGLRERCELVKCRELNDFHHAHDAYLACQISRFVAYRYPSWEDGFDLNIIRKYVRSIGANEVKPGQFLPGDAGFIVGSFLRPGIDYETGEILKDAWDAEREVARIKRALNMKQCFVTKMPEEMSGAFWDETVYSPRDSKNKNDLKTPLKASGIEGELDPRVYGGHKKVKQAYFFIFAAKDKKGRDKFFFEGVPIYLVSQIKQDEGALLAYAQKIAAESKCTDAKILRAKVLFRQKFILRDGDRSTTLYLGGKTGASNWAVPGCQVALSLQVTSDLALVLKQSEVIANDLPVFEEMSRSLGRACPKLSCALGDTFDSERYSRLDGEVRVKVIRGLAELATGKAPSIDLTMFGGSKNAAAMKVTVASAISDIIWVDQSVTGIFEKRTTFEELCRGL